MRRSVCINYVFFVYIYNMRTNIDIDDDLMNRAIKLSNSKSKKEVVTLALKQLIASLKRKELTKLRGKVKWEGDLNQMRQS